MEAVTVTSTSSGGTPGEPLREHVIPGGRCGRETDTCWEKPPVGETKTLNEVSPPSSTAPPAGLTTTLKSGLGAVSTARERGAESVLPELEVPWTVTL